MLCCGCSYFPQGKGRLSLIVCPLPRGFEWFLFVTKNNSARVSRGSTHGEANDKCISTYKRQQRAWEIWWASHKTNAVIDIWSWNSRWDGRKQSVRYYIQDQYPFLSFENLFCMITRQDRYLKCDPVHWNSAWGSCGYGCACAQGTGRVLTKCMPS